METLALIENLPVLKALPAPSKVRPVIVIDSREQTPLTFTRLESIRGTLTSGDYSFVGGEDLFAVERKTIADLVGCCTGSSRERFERELHRLRGFRFNRLLIIGDRADIGAGNYRSNVSPRAVLASLSAFEIRYDVPVVFTETPPAGAILVESWAFWTAREIVVTANALQKTAPV